MNDTDRLKLLYGSYRTPGCRVGSWLTCEVRGRVQVKAISDGRIQWPMTWQKRGGPFLIVCGGLVRAIRKESALAIGYCVVTAIAPRHPAVGPGSALSGAPFSSSRSDFRPETGPTRHLPC